MARPYCRHLDSQSKNDVRDRDNERDQVSDCCVMRHDDAGSEKGFRDKNIPHANGHQMSDRVADEQEPALERNIRDTIFHPTNGHRHHANCCLAKTRCMTSHHGPGSEGEIWRPLLHSANGHYPTCYRSRRIRPGSSCLWVQEYSTPDQLGGLWVCLGRRHRALHFRDRRCC